MTTNSKRIQKLSEAVSNRIAAGEVIQRPGNALKELLENALDANSTNIQIQVKDGGMKLLQIQDNGCGINKEDLIIACERFTTSKLTKFDDLESISTFGFRGEALASISHIAKITITSRTKNTECAYRAKYIDGKLIAAKENGKVEPMPCAGNVGTQITVEDVFYNVPLRRNAIKSPNEEYQRILDVVHRYAIHNSNVSFSVKKSTQNQPDLQISSFATTKDKIGQIYGRNLVPELLHVELKDEDLRFNLEGYVSNSSYSSRKLMLILFINGRSVISNQLKRSIDSIYSSLLSRGTHPFIYISLDLPPERVDVNVHPTKREVHFLNEDEIILAIATKIQSVLEANGASKTIQTNKLNNIGQTLIPLLSRPTEASVPSLIRSPNATPNLTNRQLQSPVVRPSPINRLPTFPTNLLPDNSFNGTTFDPDASINSINDTSFISLNGTEYRKFDKPKKQVKRMVRTDSNLQTLDAFFSRTRKSDEDGTSLTNHNSSFSATNFPVQNCQPKDSPTLINKMIGKSNNSNEPLVVQEPPKRKWVDVKLISVLELRKEFKLRADLELKKVLNNLSFVGCVDTNVAAFQSDTKLYLANYSLMSQELFYQRILIDFSNFSTLTLNPPVPIKTMVELGLQSKDVPPFQHPFDQSTDPVQELVDLLVDRADMLQEYFQIEITTDGCLNKLPVLLKDYIPPTHKLPAFLARLGSQVNFFDEKQCFHTLSKELARLYTITYLPPTTTPVTNGKSKPASNGAPQTTSPDVTLEEVIDPNQAEFFKHIQTKLFPHFKRASFYPPPTWTNKEIDSNGRMGIITQVADLPDLYKIFERC